MPVDNVYQTGSNLKVSNSRVLSHDCFEHDFETRQFGGSSITLTVPSNALFSDIMVYFKWSGEVEPGYYLPPSWGYKAIRDITYIWGGSEQLRITGEGSYLRLIAEADDEKKRLSLLQLGGSLIQNSITDDTPGVQSADAAVHIYAPCSSINANKQIPYDADLLNGNITIRIALKSAEEIWGQNVASGDTALGAITSDMRNLEVARWYLRQYTLVDTTASKKDEVGPNGQFMQPYFWYHSHTFSSGQGAIDLGVAAYPSGVSGIHNVTLNGFTNGSLQSMILYVQRTDSSYAGEVASPAPVVTRQSSFMDCRELEDIEITYNGRCVYKGQFDKVAKLLDLSLNKAGSSYDQAAMAKDPGDANRVAELTKRSSMYRIQLSQFSEVFRDYLQTGAELSANTMQLKFRIKDNELINVPTKPRTYTCNVEYIYQASVTVQKGVGRFDFQNPLPAPTLANLPAIAP